MRRCGLGILKGFAATSSSMMTSMRMQASVPPRQPLHNFDNFLNGSSGEYLDDLLAQWKQDPNSIDPMWAELFQNASQTARDTALLSSEMRILDESQQPLNNTPAMDIKQTLSECARLTWMINSFEDRGHLLAAVDPLQYEDDPNERIPSRKIRENYNVDIDFYGFTEADLDRTFSVGFHNNIGGLLDTRTPPMTLRVLRDRLMKTYCGNIGWEYRHITDEARSHWLRERIESPERNSDSPFNYSQVKTSDKVNILKNLADAVVFENTLHAKFTGQKRFGLDGGESLIVGLKAMIDRASAHGVDEVVMGMAHRGRLNCLVNIFDKPFEALLREYKGIKAADLGEFEGIQGDVKYHMGSIAHKTTAAGKSVRLELMSNPSHLECVNPFVQGKAKAAQFSKRDEHGKTVLPVEIHGDAALAGQGITFETFGISDLKYYGTHGTVHIVVNNQIGFTTDPKSSRTSAYCTDLGRIFSCPVFHVNGDSPEDVFRVFQFAADYRAAFGKSVVIDLVCYRRFGHNESDDPSMTQPLMYKKIAALGNILELYGKQLVDSKAITKEEFSDVKKSAKKRYMAAFDNVDNFDYPAFLKNSIGENWKDIKFPHQQGSMQPTATTKEALEPVIKALSNIPEGFQLHPTLNRIYNRRKDTLEKGEGLDWGTAEALAFGTLMNDGTEVRVSGQDVERATFSQRHAVFHDQKTNETYTQLTKVSEKQAPFTIVNSALSEFGVLGFETGYALHHPNCLTIWEAQFADFANGAQVIFDQFISAGETKWLNQYGILVSMPHGYDGNGPEHSSGRIERFLQSVNEDESAPIMDALERHQKCNMEVTYPSTPAQYFHLLRRHVLRDFRKPCINFFSKAFLRDPNTSTLDELTAGTFQPVIDDASVKKPKRVIFCSGQIYHYLNAERKKREVKNIALVRVEQLAPFPAQEIKDVLDANPKAELCWVQEEPKNMGAWTHIEPRIAHLSNFKRNIQYIGRQTAASPATGFTSIHNMEHAAIMDSALTL